MQDIHQNNKVHVPVSSMYPGHLRNEKGPGKKKIRLKIEGLQKLPLHERAPLNKLVGTEFVWIKSDCKTSYIAQPFFCPILENLLLQTQFHFYSDNDSISLRTVILDYQLCWGKWIEYSS